MKNNEIMYSSDTLSLELFDYLYAETYKSVYYTISRFINNESTVLDLLQDTYISSFIKFDCLGTFTIDGYQRWVNRIATNKAKDYLKRKKPALFSELAYPNSEFDAEDLSLKFNPEDYANRKELSQLFSEVMASLPKEQRICIFLYYYEDMRICEIASYLDINESTVKSRLRYGKEKMKVKLIERENAGFKLFSLSLFGLSFFLLNHEGFNHHGPYIKDISDAKIRILIAIAIIGFVLSLALSLSEAQKFEHMSFPSGYSDVTQPDDIH